MCIRDRLYAYCVGDPVNYVDIQGLKPTKIRYRRKLFTIYQNGCGLNFYYYNENITTNKVKKEIYGLSKLLRNWSLSRIKTISFKSVQRLKGYGNSNGYKLGRIDTKRRLLKTVQKDIDFIIDESIRKNRNVGLSSFVPGFSKKYLFDVAQSFVIDALTQNKTQYIHYAGWYKKFEWFVKTPDKKIYIMHYYRDPGGEKNKGSRVYPEGPY